MQDEKLRLKLDMSALAVIAVLASSVAGQFATSDNLGWYAGLAKPAFNPPNGIFAPVWGALYLLMAFAIWRVVRLPSAPTRSVALTLFFLQLALNAAWSWMFFAEHSPQLGLINIIPQFLIIVATIIVFLRLDWMAGLALVPLAAWVGFATALNAAIWQMNG
ncbi:MAG TPA: TspO/MBR family protein [Pseudolabrys sp.]|nr:TspO/MBR family protein [Pseudolabrys sp.]